MACVFDRRVGDGARAFTFGQHLGVGVRIPASLRLPRAAPPPAVRAARGSARPDRARARPSACRSAASSPARRAVPQPCGAIRAERRFGLHPAVGLACFVERRFGDRPVGVGVGGALEHELARVALGCSPRARTRPVPRRRRAARPAAAPCRPTLRRGRRRSRRPSGRCSRRRCRAPAAVAAWPPPVSARAPRQPSAGDTASARSQQHRQCRGRGVQATCVTGARRATAFGPVPGELEPMSPIRTLVATAFGPVPPPPGAGCVFAAGRRYRLRLGQLLGLEAQPGRPALGVKLSSASAYPPSGALSRSCAIALPSQLGDQLHVGEAGQLEADGDRQPAAGDLDVLQQRRDHLGHRRFGALRLFDRDRRRREQLRVVRRAVCRGRTVRPTRLGAR